MKTSDAGLALIKRYEGCRLTAYRCPAGIWTIGVGHTGKEVWANLVITEKVAMNFLKKDIESSENCINNLVTVPLLQNRFDSLVSLVFNIGCTAFSSSSLYKKLNAGNYSGAGKEFKKWNKAEGKILPGLISRRAEEAEAFS